MFLKVIDVNMLKTDRILFQRIHQIIFLCEHRLYDFFLSFVFAETGVH